MSSDSGVSSASEDSDCTKDTEVVKAERLSDWVGRVNRRQLSSHGESAAASICLFRRGSMRLKDNVALRDACKHSKVYCVYVLEHEDLSTVMGTRLATFLKECITDLNKELRKVGQRLLVFKGDIITTIKELALILGVSHLYVSDSADPREQALLGELQESVPCVIERRWQLTLFSPQELSHIQDFPLSYSNFVDLVLPLKTPELPIPGPTAANASSESPWPISESNSSIPANQASASGNPPAVDYDSPPVFSKTISFRHKPGQSSGNVVDMIYDKREQYTIPPLCKEIESVLKDSPLAACMFKTDDGCPKLWHMGAYNGMEFWWDAETEFCHKDQSKAPCSDKVKFSPMKYSHLVAGGEAAGLERMKVYLARMKMSEFRKSKMSNKWDIPSNSSCYSSGMSPYLSAGCVSVRQFYHMVAKEFGKGGAPDVDKVRKQRFLFNETLLAQVYWREFFIHITRVVPAFSSYENPVVANPTWAPKNDEAISLLANAQTGVPIVDASITQLRNYGWLNHTLRHKVAEFLTRSGLQQNWTEGVKIFRYFQLDYEYGVNECNWMWQCRVAFVSVGSIYELQNSEPIEICNTPEAIEYIVKQVPILSKLPKVYVTQPWKCPKDIQETNGCVIGVDYPDTMCDMSPEAQRQRNCHMAESLVRSSMKVMRTHIRVGQGRDVSITTEPYDLLEQQWKQNRDFSQLLTP